MLGQDLWMSKAKIDNFTFMHNSNKEIKRVLYTAYKLFYHVEAFNM